MEKLVFSLVETAEALSLPRRSLYELIKDGRIRAVKIGREWRISKEEIQRIITHGTDLRNGLPFELAMREAIVKYKNKIECLKEERVTEMSSEELIDVVVNEIMRDDGGAIEIGVPTEV